MAQRQNGRSTEQAGIASDLILQEIVADLANERARHFKEEGTTHASDDAYRNGELPRAAATYAFLASLNSEADRTEAADLDGNLSTPEAVIVWRLWPWLPSWLKPKNRRQDLVRAGGLIIAAIEQIDRAASARKPSATRDN